MAKINADYDQGAYSYNKLGSGIIGSDLWVQKAMRSAISEGDQPE